MELNDYQERAMETCMPSCENFSYMMLNLVGEVGEFASKVAKSIRKEHLMIGGAEGFKNMLAHQTMTKGEIMETIELLKSEAGDILWQLAGLCEVMNWTLEEVAQTNLDKLASRKKRGVIDGNGDKR